MRVMNLEMMEANDKVSCAHKMDSKHILLIGLLLSKNTYRDNFTCLSTRYIREIIITGTNYF